MATSDEDEAVAPVAVHQKAVKSSSDSFMPNYDSKYHPIASITARSIPSQIRADLKWVLVTQSGMPTYQLPSTENPTLTTKRRLFATTNEKAARTSSLVLRETASLSSKTWSKSKLATFVSLPMFRKRNMKVCRCHHHVPSSVSHSKERRTSNLISFVPFLIHRNCHCFSFGRSVLGFNLFVLETPGQ